MKQVDRTLEVLGWMRQSSEDSLRWLRDVKGINDARLLEAYSAGFENGWRNAVNALKLHDMITTNQL